VAEPTRILEILRIIGRLVWSRLRARI
jgi:hypothetical protein